MYKYKKVKKVPIKSNEFESELHFSQLLHTGGYDAGKCVCRG